MQTRVRQRLNGYAGSATAENGSGNDIEEIDMSDVLDHLEDIDRMSSRKQDEAFRDSQECLDELTNAGLFRVLKTPLPADSITVDPEEPDAD